MKNTNKTVGRVVVISLTILLGSLTYALGFGKAIFAVVMLVGWMAVAAALLVPFILYLHYLFGNNNYRDFNEYLDNL